METIEDLYTASYVVDLLTPMLENAGAYVMLPRERDTSPWGAIIDRDSKMTPGYSETKGTNAWQTYSTKGYAMTDSVISDGHNPFSQGTARIVKTVADESQESTARWTADVPHKGTYSIYVSYPSLPNSSTRAIYKVNSLRGVEEFAVDQTMGGSTWIRLGEFPLAQGKSGTAIVELTNAATGENVGKVVGADAVKIGGGMGIVARGDKASATTSGMPSWTEAARYYLQSAGMPKDVYAPEEGKNDYSQDFRSRPLWVNYLAGGSSKAPREKGLRIPIDLALALHSDAGITPDSTIIGTLGIYSSDGGRRLGDGRRRTVNRDLTESVVNSVVNDLQAKYQPDWTKRKTRDRKYAEARIPVVPSTLIELLSHQNFADMRLGRDPQFRFDAARAIYKGILRHLSGKGKYTVQPLPINTFAIESDGHGKLKLTWKETVDTLEPTAAPTSYIVERRIDDGAFTQMATVRSPHFATTISPGAINSFRIVAVNDGGRSFPSETLAACYLDNGNPEVLIVNAFTRISGPEAFDSEGEAGFLDALDHGVPYARDIAFTGAQYDFDRESPWIDDIEQPGFGASRTDNIGRIDAGNTFDYPYIHGLSLRAAGFSFVATSVDAYVDQKRDYRQPIVDVILGKQREVDNPNFAMQPRFKTFTNELQEKLRKHLKAGGNLLVSGSYIASDLFENRYSDPAVLEADIDFARNVLGFDFYASFAAVSGRVDVLPFWANDFNASSLNYANEVNESIYVVESPDAIVPSVADKSSTIMIYDENRHSAAIAWADDRNSVIVMGFPFEAIMGATSRDIVMKEIMGYLTTVKIPIVKTNRNLPPIHISLPVDQPFSIDTASPIPDLRII